MGSEHSRCVHLCVLIASICLAAAGPLSAQGFSDGASAGVAKLDATWFWSPLATEVGLSGLSVADLDLDGEVELIAGASRLWATENRLWYTLAWDGANYVRDWTPLPVAHPIVAIEVAQADADPQLEVLVAAGAGVSVYDGGERSLQRTIAVDVEAADLVVGDVDGDGEAEIVVCGDGGLFSYSAETGRRELALPGMGGDAMAVGQADGDAALEIALTSHGGAAYVVDGATGLVQWHRADGLGYVVRFGDLDEDGRDELLGGFLWTTGIRAYDVVAGTLLWELPVFNLDAFRIADLQGDSRPEVLYGDAQWGSVHVLDADGVELWSVGNPAHGVTDIAVGDMDRDGVREILWGSAGGNPVGPDSLYVVDPQSQDLEWSGDINQNGPFLGLDFGDIDADGDGELLVTSFLSDEAYEDGRYLIFDAKRRSLEHVSEEPRGNAFPGVWGGKLLDIDFDPQLEICMTTADGYSGWIACFDGRNHEEEWHFEAPNGLTFASLIKGDVDGDGELELIAGTTKEHTGAPGVFVYALEPTGTLLWRSPDLGNSWYRITLLEIGDVDGDGELEIVVGAEGAFLAILDAATGHIELPAVEHPISALELVRADDFSVPTIVIGTHEGGLEVVDPATGSSTPIRDPWPAPVDAVEQIELGDRVIYVISSGGYLSLHETLGSEALDVLYVGEEVGRYDSLLVGSFGADDGVGLLANNSHGVVELVVLGKEIFADGFETGDTSAWSGTVP